MRSVRSMFVLALVAGFTALIAVACGDSSAPTSVIAVGGAPIAGAAVSLDAEGGSGKVDVCHVTGNGSINRISVSGNAVSAHQAHGAI